MAKLTVKIEVQNIWLEELTDLSQCEGCQEIIYGKMFRLCIAPKAGCVHLRGHETNMVLCQSCYELTKFDS